MDDNGLDMSWDEWWEWSELDDKIITAQSIIVSWLNMVQGTLDWNRLPSDDMMIPAQGNKQKEGNHKMKML